jgi:hypothetical protein
LGPFSRLLSGYQHSAPTNEKDPAGFRKLNPSGIPRKQLEPKFIFQIADLLTQCGLRDMKPVSCPPKARFLGDRNKIAEVTQLHSSPFGS